MILPFIAILAIGTLVVAVWWFATEGAHQRELDRIDARRREQQAHARRVQRQAEARMHALVIDAMQQMTHTAATAPHSSACLCDRCLHHRSSHI